MKKLLFIIWVLCLIFITGCENKVSNLVIDDDNSFVTIIKWETYKNGKFTLYEYKEGLGISRLTTKRSNSGKNTLDTKTVDAKMDNIIKGDGFVSFTVNGVKYVYRPK